MKLLFALAAVACFSVMPALAGDGRISDHSLAKMGLGSVKMMSDANGMQIRGLGCCSESCRGKSCSDRDCCQPCCQSCCASRCCQSICCSGAGKAK